MKTIRFINDLVKNRIQEENKQVKFYYSPSNLGQCERYLYCLASELVKPQSNIELLSIYNEGRIHESDLVNLLKEYIPNLEEQKTVNIPLPKRFDNNPRILKGQECEKCGSVIKTTCIHGHVDLASPRSLIEFKSVSNSYWQNVKNRIFDRDSIELMDFLKPYVTQLGLYLLGANYTEENNKHGRLYLKNKQTGLGIELILNYNKLEDRLKITEYSLFDESGDIVGKLFVEIKGFWKGILEKIDRVENALKDRTNRYDLSCGRCEVCGISKHCQIIFNIKVEKDLEKDKKLILVDTDLINNLIQERLEIDASLKPLSEKRDEINAIIENYLNKIIEKIPVEERVNIVFVSPKLNNSIYVSTWKSSTLNQEAYNSMPPEDKKIFDELVEKYQLVDSKERNYYRFHNMSKEIRRYISQNPLTLSTKALESARASDVNTEDEQKAEIKKNVNKNTIIMGR